MKGIYLCIHFFFNLEGYLNLEYIRLLNWTYTWTYLGGSKNLYFNYVICERYRCCVTRECGWNQGVKRCNGPTFATFSYIIFSIFRHLVWLSQYKTALWILCSSYKTANSKNWILGSDWRRCIATLQGEIPVWHIRLLFQSISPSKTRLVWQAVGFNTALNAGSTNPTFLLANFL